MKNENGSVLDDVHMLKLMGRYSKACEMEPEFCHGLLPGWNVDNVVSQCIKQLEDARARCDRGRELKNLLWNEILNEKVWEIEADITHGADCRKDAVGHAYDAIAVLLRLIDALEGRIDIPEQTSEFPCNYAKEATEAEVDSGMASWCLACGNAECPISGKEDALVMCGGFVDKDKGKDKNEDNDKEKEDEDN